MQDLPLHDVLESFLQDVDLHSLFQSNKNFYTTLMSCYYKRLLWPIQHVINITNKKYVKKIDAQQNTITTNELINFKALVQLINVEFDDDEVKLSQTLQTLSCDMGNMMSFKCFWPLINLQSLTIRSIQPNHTPLKFNTHLPLTSLHMGEFNASFDPGALPSNLITLSMPAFNHPFSKGMLPNGIKTLFLSDFAFPLDIGVLPEALENLWLHNAFNCELQPNVFPQHLQKLHLSHNFNQALETNVLPQGLVSLIFGNNFNQPLEPYVLPATLTKLILSWDFSQPIEAGTLPLSLNYLSFGGDFNQRLDVGVLPSNLSELNLGGSSHTIHKNVLPQSLTSLKLGYWFKQDLPLDVLPSTLSKLEFGHKFDREIESGVLPTTLCELRFGACFNQRFTPNILPPNLTRLEFDSFWGHGIPEGYNQPFDVGVLPVHLIELKLSFTFHRSLQTLPTNLQHLHVSDKLFKARKKFNRFSNMKITLIPRTPDFNHIL